MNKQYADSRDHILRMKFLCKPLFALLGLSLALGLALEMPMPALGQGSDDPIPKDLLRATPFDRVTLNDGKVLLVDPISPRPLPPFDPLKEKSRPEASKVGNVFIPGEREKLGLPKEEEEKQVPPSQVEIPLHLLQGEIRDYKIKRGLIKKVEYFEDLLLADGERLVRAGDFAKAFESYLRVQNRQGNWPGLDDHVNQLLFEEGSAALRDGDGERGVRLLRELFARKPKYPGVSDKLATAYGTRASRAFDLGLYAKGRRILHELEPLAPNHPTLREVQSRFITRAQKLAEDAGKASGDRRLDMLVEGLRVWPTLEGLGDRYATSFREETTLDVAVTDVPHPIGPWIETPADERINRLLFLPLFAHDDEDSIQGKAHGQLASGLESGDLGRKLVVSIRKSIPWSDGSRPVSSADVARAFIDRASPTSPAFNARWAENLKQVETPDDSKVEIQLARALLKPASWLIMPVGPAHAGFDGRVVMGDQSRVVVGDGPYQWSASNETSMVLRGAKGMKIRRIRELVLPSAEACIGSLVRGDISLLEHVPSYRVASLASQADIKIGRYSRPSLHRIALDGRTPALRNRALRRGISYAVDRRTLLEETLLKHPPDAANLVSDGPFAKGSYADAVGIEPFTFDPYLAKMLVAAARKEMGGNPIKLTLEYPALPEAQAVIPKIVEVLKVIGLEITTKEWPESQLEAELRSGRRFDLAYRASRPEEPVLEAGRMLCPGYDAPSSGDALASVASPRILQLLLQLERAPEWPTAKGIATQIDAETRDELPVIPLWQLEDHYAWRTRLQGPPEVADTLYQGIETWEIQPWYAKDPW
ncbi:ABC transporter substrate-binding protein [Singulisphaera sp. PoT]|uniref:ABC transporter substrate-binding protein n=1 Tax=Singulisphaera sp. PoT TaxID=3411797 RepID=UPI003BF49A66